MHPVLRALVERDGGVVTRRAVVQVVPAWVLTHAHRVGQLRRVLPGVYVDAALITPTASTVSCYPHRAGFRCRGGSRRTRW